MSYWPRFSAIVSTAVTATLAVSALFAGALGCGGDRELSAEELVAEYNANALANSSLELGEELLSTAAAPGEVFALTLELPDPLAAEPSEDAAHLGSGSLVVLDDEAEGLIEFNRCERSASLICYRAANVVLRFEDLDPSGQSAVARTLQAVSDAAASQ